jgi:predicted dehydrogenase
MKVLIIGLGSIAQKHVSALKELVTNITLYALRSRKESNSLPGIINLFDWDEIPEDISFIIISNPTASHLETIKEAIKLRVPLFIEKPPFMNMEGVDVVLEKIKEEGIQTYTAFNLRFHPIIEWLKTNIRDRNVIEVQIYCGSYLPDWRPGKDFRETYSAKQEMGGGVHLDLIHELDYATWIFGHPLKSFTAFSKFSNLHINSCDSAHYWLEYQKMGISILLNYFRKDPKRSLEIVMENDTWNVDLLKGTIVNSSGNKIFQTKQSIKETYKGQMAYFLKNMKNAEQMMNNLDEAVRTLKLCLNNA